MSNNALSGSVPSFLTSLTKLRYLDLRVNHLTGTLPSTESMGALTLARLALDNNDLATGPTCPPGSEPAYNAIGVGTVAMCDDRCVGGDGSPIAPFTSGKQGGAGGDWADGTELCWNTPPST